MKIILRKIYYNSLLIFNNIYCNEQISIILVGNKIDVRGENTTNENLKEEIMPILKNFKVKIISIVFYIKFILSLYNLLMFEEKD